MILVSAIVPTYNRSYVIAEAIRSILNQSYPRVEIIVVDDGSTDDTLVKLEEFGEKIRVISQANAGPAAARNRGIGESRGQILTFLDSDDVWLPTYIERQAAVLERAGETVPCSLANGWLEFADGQKRTAFGYADLIPDHEEGLWTNPDEIFATRFIQFNQMVAVRRSALDRVGPFDSSLRYLEDWDLALRLSLGRPWCFVREPLVIWRQRKKDSLSRAAQSDDLALRRSVVAVRKRAIKMFQDQNCSPNLHRLMVRELGHNNRELRAATLSARGKFGSLLGTALKGAEKVREFALARSNAYPKMRIGSIGSGVNIGALVS